jgi:glucuronate isomerase
VRASFRQPGWSREVIDRLNIRYIGVNNLSDYDYPELPGVGVAVPSRSDFDRDGWVGRILAAPDQRGAGHEAKEQLAEAVGKLHTMGVRGMRVDIEPFEDGNEAMLEMPDDLPVRGADKSAIDAFLAHAQLRALSAHGFFAQLFLGIERDVTTTTSMGVDDPRRIKNLYPLFERHACGFELVIGAPGNNLDAVQPARIYPNVHLGGLWWYNFRSSTYRQAMQYRLEAVPARKCALVASDARCIEWCYGKILLVKRLLADFLFDQIDLGWIDRDAALWVAREWLHDAAARRYLPEAAGQKPGERFAFSDPSTWH